MRQVLNFLCLISALLIATYWGLSNHLITPVTFGSDEVVIVPVRALEQPIATKILGTTTTIAFQAEEKKVITPTIAAAEPTAIMTPSPTITTPSIITSTEEAALSITPSLKLIGQIGGRTQTVAVEGDYAYLGIGLRLVTLDISNPAQPTQIWQTGILTGLVSQVIHRDDLLYVSTSSDLHVFNLSNPPVPIQIGGCNCGKMGYMTMAEAEIYIYTLTGTGELNIIDISDPVTPKLIGKLILPLGLGNPTYDLAVAGDIAYVAAEDGLHLVDVSNPIAPHQIDVYRTDFIIQLVVSRDYIYGVAPESGGIQIIDITDPTGPVHAGFYQGPFTSLTVEGNQAYLIERPRWKGGQRTAGGVHIVDITEPIKPEEIGFYSTIATDVVVINNVVYIFGDGLELLDISEPTTPIKLGFYNTMNTAFEVAVVDNMAYIACERDGLCLVDVANIHTPTLTTTFNPWGGAAGVTQLAAISNTLYIAANPVSSQGFLSVVKVISPTVPQEVGAYHPSPAGQVQDVIVTGDRAYVSVSSSGLHTLDISTPLTPNLIGLYSTQDEALTVVDKTAYMASGNNGLRIMDLSNPATPRQVGTYNPNNDNFYSILIAEATVYLTGFRYLETDIVDISDLTSPKRVGMYELGEWYRGVVAEDLAYILEKGNLRILDISSPTMPKEIGLYEGLDAHTVAVVDETVYVGTENQGLLIFSTQNSD